MQFFVLGYDGNDEKAVDRRLAAREKHLQTFKENYDKGIFLYGAAILNDEGKMIGSMIVCEFESKDELKQRWLDSDPYITGKVWQRLEIRRAQVPSFVY